MAARWILTISKNRLTFTAEKTKPGSTRTTTKTNLLNFDAPRIMTEWLVGSIRVPIAAVIKTTAAKPAATTATINVLLRVGGDIVWSQSTEVPLVGLAEEEKVKTANFMLAADLVNPIVLPQGKSFTIEATISATTEADTLGVGLAEETTPALEQVLAGSGPEAQGAVAYVVRELTGHRVLS